MRREMIGMLCTATMAWAAPSYGQQTVQSDPRVAEFVPEGKLKNRRFSFDSIH